MTIGTALCHLINGDHERHLTKSLLTLYHQIALVNFHGLPETMRGIFTLQRLRRSQGDSGGGGGRGSGERWC